MSEKYKAIQQISAWDTGIERYKPSRLADSELKVESEIVDIGYAKQRLYKVGYEVRCLTYADFPVGRAAFPILVERFKEQLAESVFADVRDDLYALVWMLEGSGDEEAVKLVWEMIEKTKP